MSISSIYEKTNQGRRLNITWNAILTIAGRDVTRFVREPMRLAFSLILPLILIGGLAGPMQSSFGSAVHYSLITFSMTGLLAMTLFQTAMSGLMSLIEDRENDFTQELFIAPISRYAIVFGKILGESLVALVQGVVLVLVGVLLFHVPMSFSTLLFIVPVSLISCLLGGAFGVLLVSLFSNQRTANMVMPFLMFPQFFLAGIFLPVRSLPWYLDILSRITPMRYAVDLMRGVFYAGRPEAADVLLMHPIFNLIIIAVLFTLFLCIGTFFFVRAERNR
ncbi:ABC transporter [Reticulibacter mediterranei]|uniref:Transport permease protein n=1 Tax=Reticulibacter mediterranei TaxID=2778369 RepID=A0A8J3IU39_9CHLR|nr:ABC transporter permease [Reticulibacter mediterranei]GHO96915.1 ABC transporter [Reticulibacter mediterranei]